MKRLHLLLLSAALTAALQGCHCCGCSNLYNDSIDNVSDHVRNGPKFDKLYCEDLDPSRYCLTGPARRTDCPSTFPRHRPR